MSNKQVPIKEGLFTLSAKEPQLLASKCKECGTITFPAIKSCRNPDCDSEKGIEEVVLGDKGKLDTFTIMMYLPPPPWKGPQSMVPFGQGFIEMPSGLRIASVLTIADPKELKIGMDMELVIDKLYEDEEGNDVMNYKFKPAKK